MSFDKYAAETGKKKNRDLLPQQHDDMDSKAEPTLGCGGEKKYVPPINKSLQSSIFRFFHCLGFEMPLEIGRGRVLCLNGFLASEHRETSDCGKISVLAFSIAKCLCH